jgi:hypothetical protein
LREPTFRQGRPKQVDHAPGFTDRTGLMKGHADLRANLHAIIDAFGKGNLLPASCYRRGLGRTHDEMLDLYGINHVHLDDGGGDVLLFYIEYADFVLLLEIDHHRDHFKAPVGKTLLGLHRTGLTAADARAVARIQAKRGAARAGLLRGRKYRKR